MPALCLFRRRTMVGGDDLQPTAYFIVAVRAVQLTVFLTPIIGHIVKECDFRSQVLSLTPTTTAAGFLDFLLYDVHADDSCRHSNTYCWLLVSYVVASFLHGFASMILEWRIAQWSSVGNPTTEVEPRTSKVAALLERKLVPYSILLFVIWVVGLTAGNFAHSYYRCKALAEYEHRNHMTQSPQSNSPLLPWTTDVYYKSMLLSQTTSGEFQKTLPMSAFDKYSQDTREEAEELQTTYKIRYHFRLWWVTLILLLISQLVEVLMSWIFLARLLRLPLVDDPSSANRQPSSDQNDINLLALANHELVEEMWAERCSMGCQILSIASCFLFGGRDFFIPGSGGAGNDNFGDVARALADYLEAGGVLNVVPSDMAIGLVVLQRLQQQRLYRARLSVVRAAAIESTTEMAAQQSSMVTQYRSLDARPREQDQSAAVEAGLQQPAAATTNQGLLPTVSCKIPAADTRPGSSSTTIASSNPPSLRHTGSSTETIYRFNAHDGSFTHCRRKVFHRTNLADMSALDEGARYAKYALAIYTWVLYLYVHPATGIARLLTKSLCSPTSSCCCCCLGKKRTTSQRGVQRPTAPTSFPGGGTDSHVDNGLGHIDGDNICETHKAALLLTTGIEECDLVYAQLKSSFTQNPYCIILDHKWKSVVLAVRGTFSLEDCVRDVLIDPEPLEQLGRDYGFDATDQYCHGGVLACVRNVYRDLQRHGWLDKLLLGEYALYPGYTLRLTGHSLGAATCTILSYMLRPRFPTLRCLNYSPPGCTLSLKMATDCHEWCSSFVLDSDLVPRLSFESMQTMRDEILELIGRVKVPKIEVARRVLKQYGALSRHEIHPVAEEDLLQTENVEDLLYAPNEVPDSNYQRQLQRFRLVQEERRRSRGVIRLVKLYPPGKIIHLVKVGERRSCWHDCVKCLTCCTTNAGFQYLPMWINNDDLNEILVSPTMVTDHFPNRIATMLEGVAADFGLDVQ